MKHLFACLVGLLICLTGAAQSVNWAQRLGNSKSDKVTSVKTDGKGNIYIAGYFSNSLTLGTNNLVLNHVANVQSKEAFVAKLDSNGVCLWARAGGAYFDDRILGMDVDSAGYCVVTGTFWEGSGINFGSFTITGNGYGSGDQCFIVKIDPNGVPLWGRFVCGNDYGDDQGFDAAFDKNGNIFVTGFLSNDTLICGPYNLVALNPNKSGHKQCYWLAKLDGNGVFQWAKTFGHLPWDPSANKYVERDLAICVDEQNSVYVTGGFDGKRAFQQDTLTSVAGSQDVFVIKFDNAGTYKWVTQAASNKDDWSNGICSDKNGHIYITGEHRDSLYMDSVLVKNYDKRDLFIFKMDAQTGKPYWGKRAGSNEGNERGNDVWADNHCNVYVCGDINEGAKFGDNITIPATGLGVQGFVARISPEGKWRWVTTGGGADDEDRVNAIAKGKGRQLYVGGFFRISATYGSSYLSSAGSSDGFLARLHDSMLDKGEVFDLQPPAKTVLCFGDTAHMTIPPHAMLQINPSSGITVNNDSTEIVFHPATTISYTILGLGTGDCGLYDSVTFTISVGKEAISLNPPNDTSFCRGESMSLQIPWHDQLQINPSQGVVLNSNQSMATFTPVTTTHYVVTAGRQGVCPSSDTLEFTVTVHPIPKAEFEVSPQTIFIDQPAFTLSNKTTDADQYAWYDSTGLLFSTAFSPTVTAPGLGTYCFRLVASNAGGCVDSAIACGKVIQREKVFIPTAFSPNGDGHNDVFRPMLVDVDFSLVNGYSFQVVNRWGMVLFKSFQPGQGWDGTANGMPCDVGTYFYSCSFTTPQGKHHDMKGDVSLIR